MITIRTSDGEYTGRTRESIVRRAYGRNATIIDHVERIPGDIGYVVEPSRARDDHSSRVLAVLRDDNVGVGGDF